MAPPPAALLEQLCYDIFHLHLSTEEGQRTVQAAGVDRLALQVLRKRGPKLDPLVEGLRTAAEDELHVLSNGVAVLCTESHSEIIAAGALQPLVALVGPACIEALLTNLDVRCDAAGRRDPSRPPLFPPPASWFAAAPATPLQPHLIAPSHLSRAPQLACRHPRGGDAVGLVSALVKISSEPLPENPLPARARPTDDWCMISAHARRSKRVMPQEKSNLSRAPSAVLRPRDTVLPVRLTRAAPPSFVSLCAPLRLWWSRL